MTSTTLIVRKGRKLLLEHLNSKQKEEFRKHKHFHVKKDGQVVRITFECVCFLGKGYIIKEVCKKHEVEGCYLCERYDYNSYTYSYGESIKIRVPKAISHYCIGADTTTEDEMLMKKLLIESGLRRFKQIARHGISNSETACSGEYYEA
jgi:hypothetical protein